MVKEPRPGRVKTRLGRNIGMTAAAWWFRHQTARLLRRLRDPRWQIVLAVAPDRAGLADAVDRLRRADWPLTGASDHGVSEAVYTDDPDGIGVELYRDRPRDEWPVAQDGSIRMFTEPLDLRNLMAELRD